ncbi:hypothetical protein GCM10023100_13420 [Actinocorallia cavernae]|uniref:Uncharacterized protein n=1 Tax=Actinocorallia cavernae TaxID=328075 RepID=A0ABP8SEU6_9ACTN
MMREMTGTLVTATAMPKTSARAAGDPLGPARSPVCTAEATASPKANGRARPEIAA